MKLSRKKLKQYRGIWKKFKKNKAIPPTFALKVLCMFYACIIVLNVARYMYLHIHTYTYVYEIRVVTL